MWLFREEQEGVTPWSASEIARLGTDGPSWRELSDQELRAAAQGLGNEIADGETRLVNLDRISELRNQLPERSPIDDSEGEPMAANEIRSSLEHYRRLASDAREEAVRRGLVETSTGFLDVPGGEAGPEVDPFTVTPDGPVIAP